MSRRPGIGLLAIEEFANALNSSAGALYMARHGDVPVAFRIGGRMLPLGRTVRDHLRFYFFGESGQPKAAKEVNEKRFFAEHMPFVPPDASPTLRRLAMEAFSEEVDKSHQAAFNRLKQRGRQIAAKHRIANSRKSL